MRRGLADWKMATEALLLLAVFRARLARTPVKVILGRLTRERIGVHPASADIVPDAPNNRELAIARRVEWSVSAAARHSPVEFVCFPQTLAGYKMLRRRDVCATIVYGVKRSELGELLAHTWLMVGEKIVTGADGMAGYTPVERWR